MDNLSIRITQRTEDGNRAIERTIELGCPAASHDDDHRSAAMARWERAMARAEALSLDWSATLCNGERVNHAAAAKACAELGEGWRLPTRVELESILDLARHDPAIDTERFPDTKSGAYWSSTPYAAGSSGAWFVLFGLGYSLSYPRVSGGAFVRAVRSLPAGQ